MHPVQHINGDATVQARQGQGGEEEAARLAAPVHDYARGVFHAHPVGGRGPPGRHINDEKRKKRAWQRQSMTTRE